MLGFIIWSIPMSDLDGQGLAYLTLNCVDTRMVNGELIL